MNETYVRVPVISDPDELRIPWQTLKTIIAGKSLIDTLELHIDNLEESHKFLHAYGLDTVDDLDDPRKTALEYIDKILLDGTCLCLPDKAYQLSLPELLVEASTRPKTELAEWSCVILKVCHAVAHSQWTRDEDAYEEALLKVQSRLKPYLIESSGGLWIGDDKCRIPLVEYRIKSRKKFFRLLTKLLLKEGNLSAGIYDHIGMRFVTNDIFSAILLIKFLRSRHIYMYANIVPQASKNSIAEFRQIEEMFSEFSGPIRDAAGSTGTTTWPGSENRFSSKKFKMIKIVERILVNSRNGHKVFVPFEIQILTRQTQESLGEKKLSHLEYEKRQVRGVRRRLFRGTSLADGH